LLKALIFPGRIGLWQRRLLDYSEGHDFDETVGVGKTLLLNDRLGGRHAVPRCRPRILRVLPGSRPDLPYRADRKHLGAMGGTDPRRQFPVAWEVAEPGETGIAIIGAEPAGLRKFRGSALVLAKERIGSGEISAKDWMSRNRIPRLFEPDDRFLGARLQQMRHSYLLEPNAELRITRAEPDGTLDERDRLFDRPGVELALAETEERIDPVAIQFEHPLVVCNRLGEAALRAQ